MHGIFWFEDAPDLHSLTPHDSEKIRKTIEYFDEFLSTWHPDPDETYDIHPSKIHFSDASNEDSDYNHLIRAVQIHICSKAYCRRKRKDSNEMVC